MGLILGGVLTEYLSWRYTLYVNLIFAAFAIAGALAWISSSRPATRPRLDWAGTVLASDPAAEQQQATEGQRVGGDHPLPVGVREAQVALGGRQSDVHDGAVEDSYQLGEGNDHQNPPAALV